ncbi:amino acid adenylation domain-containing protein [Streptomyces sp. NPDC014685]|uniref:amino acid adenylation domain-containing protein n=1 Tax=Streptomyces sp. NPDC014685 TaxID=3364881 RepID=UPI0036F572C5
MSARGRLVPSRADSGGRVPLSPAQDGIWIADQLHPGEPTYTTPMAVRLRGPLSRAALTGAVADIVARHEVLRTVVRTVEGRPWSCVRASGPPAVATTDLTGLAPADRYPAAVADAVERAGQYIDPAGPMGRFHLYRLADDDHLLFLAVHHLVWDGWSISVFFRDLSEFYRSRVAGGSPDLPVLPVQYADYAVWQRDRFAAAGTAAADLGHWRAELSDDLAPFELPRVLPAGGDGANAGAVTQLLVPTAELSRIKAFARAERVSVFMVLKTALHAVLHRLTGVPKVSTVFPSANRDAAELEDLIGLFVNQLVLRTDCAGDPSFRDLLHQVRGKVLRAFRHAELPFEWLVRELGIDRDSSRNPLDQVRLGFQNATDASLLDLPGVHGEVVELHSGAVKEKLDLVAWEQPAGLELVAAYNTGVFDELAANRLLRRLARVMSAACADPGRPLSELPLLVEGERAELVRAGGSAPGGEPAATVHELLDAQIARAPGARALVCGAESVSYRELGARADLLAGVLRGRGVRRGDAVGVYLGRSVDFAVVALAVFRVGGYYVPLDPDVPPARTAFLLADAAPAVVVTSAGLAPALPVTDCPVVRLAPGWHERAQDHAEAPAGDGSDADYAYVMYTSGSTGRPKAATLAHRSVVEVIRHQQSVLPLGVGDRVLQRAPLTFDVSVMELFWPLCCGATVVVVPPDAAADVRALARLAREQRVTAMFLVPSLVRAFLAAGPSALPHLRALFCTGEALTPELIGRVRESAPEAAVVNIYGATEASIYATTWSLPPGAEVPAEIPVGVPRPGVRCHVLDTAGRPLPAGSRGELYQGGGAVTPECGYPGRPALTAERFVPDPFGSVPGARLYRTGDLVRMCRDGSLYYAGRADWQFKRDGVRIEPGEIQAVLEGRPDVAHAHVTPYSEGEVGHLVAYLVPAPGAGVDVEAVRRAAATALPRQLVPSRYVCLDALPLTANGKVDARALPPPVAPAPTAKRRTVPRDGAERTVAGCVAGLLGLEEVWADDDFFHLGGTSLQAAELAYRLGEEFGTGPDVRAVFEARSVAELAARMAGGGERGLAGGALPLAADARLDPAITAEGVRPVDAERVADPRHVLLTGATGFVGAFLLRELLDRTRAQVYCLVRAADDGEAARRVEEVLRSYGLWDDTAPARTTALAGDLGLALLGLGEERFADLAGTLDTIHHNGARVNHLESYGRLRASNVSGTVEVLRLATTGRLKPVHFVSTTGLAYGTGDNPPVLAEDRRVPPAEVLPNGYVASKWVAEELVRVAGGRGVPVVTYRPGRVSGHSVTGAAGTADAFWNLVRAMCLIGAAPDVGLTADLVPVDHVAGAIVHLSRRPGSFGTTFHVTNPRPVPVRLVVDRLRVAGRPLVRLPVARWQERLSSAAAEDPSLSLVAAQSGSSGAFGPVVFARDNTERALAGAPVPAAEVDEPLLDRYLEYFVRNGFLPAPPTYEGESAGKRR